MPDDPMFQLTFPQRDMLAPEAFDRMARLHRAGAGRAEIQALARELRVELNVYPAGQMERNRTSEGEGKGEGINGLQHKYRETLLFFPGQGKPATASTFCFRWAQFVGDKALRIASTDAGMLHDYLRRHPTISDLLMSGGDRIVMKDNHLKESLTAFLSRLSSMSVRYASGPRP